MEHEDREERRIEVTDTAAASAALAAGFRFEGIRRGVPDLAIFARLAGDPPGPVAPALADLPPDGLHDGVIAVRVALPADAAAVHEQESDPVRIAGGFHPGPPGADEVRRDVARAGLDWLVGRGGRTTIVDLATGRCAGSVSLRFAGPPQVGGIGYVVHPDFRGRGYAARALRLLVPWAFEVADFARLELGAKESNVASQKAALAAGFEREAPRLGRMRAPDGTFTEVEARFYRLNPRYVSR